MDVYYFNSVEKKESTTRAYFFFHSFNLSALLFLLEGIATWQIMTSDNNI